MEYIYTALNLATQTDDFYLICIIVALALLVRAAIGFGDGLLAVPLLAMLIELKEAVALILFLSTTISVYPLWKDRHHLQFDSLKRTSTAALLAIPLGVLLLGVANEQIMKGFLGALLTSLSFWKLKSVEIMKMSGFDEEDMTNWHKKFEEMEPEEHQLFLESLGIKQEEIKQIRNC